MKRFIAGLMIVSTAVTSVFSVSENPSVGPRQHILLMDFNALNCPLCTQPLAAFLQAVRKRGLKNIAGVVICDRALLKSEANRKIIRKQVRGFALGFDIGFPIGLDEDGSFAPLGRQTAMLLVIDGGRKTLEKYPLPLKNEDLERILF